MHAVRNGKRRRTEGFRAEGFRDRGNPREKDARTQLPKRRGVRLDYETGVMIHGGRKSNDSD